MATTQTSKSSSSKRASSKTASKSKSTTASKAKSAQPDAIKLLTQDHREVEKMFKDFEKAEDNRKKQQLAQQICLALKVHTQIEEELFYPPAERAFDDEDDEMVKEAYVEHNAAKELIGEIEQMKPSDEFFDAKVKVLKEQVEHHVEEEEKELFPETRKTNMDLQAIGDRLAERKAELMAQMTGGRSRAH